MATIKDVARHAEVSVTTVSHVVNGTRHVSAEGRERVEQAIRALGYVPSAIARSLKRNNTRTLGMLIPNSSNPYFAEIVHAVEDRAFGAGYNVILCNTNDEPHRQGSYLQVLAERRIDGLIVVSTGQDATLPTQLAGLQVPTVLVDREVEIDEQPGDLVETAHMQGGLLATQHLLALGHRRIACIHGPAGLRPSEQRIAGWRGALAAAGCDHGDALLWNGHFTSQGGHDAMQAMLAASSSAPPTAVFVCNDLMAMGALCAAHERGLRVPESLSLVGFDDMQQAAFANPSLTTVHLPLYEVGLSACERLIDRIRGKGGKVAEVMPTHLVVRDSTAMAPAFSSTATPA